MIPLAGSFQWNKTLQLKAPRKHNAEVDVKSQEKPKLERVEKGKGSNKKHLGKGGVRGPTKELQTEKKALITSHGAPRYADFKLLLFPGSGTSILFLSFSLVTLEGIASDQGLFCPQSIKVTSTWAPHVVIHHPWRNSTGQLLGFTFRVLENLLNNSWHRHRHQSKAQTFVDVADLA